MRSIEKKIAARLLQNGDLSERDLEKVLSIYTGETPLADLLVARGFISPAAACRANAEANGFQFVSLTETVPTAQAIARLTLDQAWRMRVVPVWFEDGALAVAMSDPSNVLAPDELRIKLRCSIVPMIAERADLKEALLKYYGPPPNEPGMMSSDNVRLAAFEKQAEAAEETQFDRRSTVIIPKPDLSDYSTSHGEGSSLVETTWSGASTVPESRDGQRSSSSSVIISDPGSHREYQRFIRTMKKDSTPSATSPGISSVETQMFEEASTQMLTEIEARRVERGVYDAPKASEAAVEAAHPADPEAVSFVRSLLTSALEDRAEEIEFTPLDKSIRLRRRVDGVWENIAPYPVKLHDQIIHRLLRISNIRDVPDDSAIESTFELPSSKGGSICVAWFEPTVQGWRAVLRFPENSPLFSNPLLAIGISDKPLQRILSRLEGRGGGLLLVSGPHTRTLKRLHASIVRSLAAAVSHDIVSLERPLERRIPGVTQINCPNLDVLFASLANASFMNPDILAVSSVENGSVLNKIIDVALHGTGVVASYNAPTSWVALHCYKAALIDPMNIIRGVIGHVHTQEANKLCPHCRKTIEDRDSLPEWAREMAVDFQEKTGCDRCGGTGVHGTVWLTEYHVPDEKAADGSFTAVIDRDRDIIAASLAGDIDPRDFEQ